MIDPGMLVSKYGIKIAERETEGGVKDRNMYKGDRKGKRQTNGNGNRDDPRSSLSLS